MATEGVSLAGWISAVASVASAVAVAIGVGFAWVQLDGWRREARNRRRAEVAEELLAAAYNAADVIQSLRSPFSRVPRDEAHNRTYIYEQRWKRLVEQNSVFEALRHAQMRARAVIGERALEDAVDEIYSIRGEIVLSLEEMVEYEGSPDDLESDERQRVKEFRAILFGRFNDKDELHVKLAGVLERLGNILGPICRLERNQ